MCILHNLSYRLDAEVPTRYRQLEYNTRNAYTDKSSTGCFSNKSGKMMVSTLACRTRPCPPAPHRACLPHPPCIRAMASGPSTHGGWAQGTLLAHKRGLSPWEEELRPPQESEAPPTVCSLAPSDCVMDIFSLTWRLGVARALRHTPPPLARFPLPPDPPRFSQRQTHAVEGLGCRSHTGDGPCRPGV